MSRVTHAPFLAVVALLGACGPYNPFHVEVFDGLGKARDIAQRLAMESMDDVVGGNAVLGQGGPTVRAGGVTVVVRASRRDRGTPTLDGATLSEQGSQSATIPVMTSSSMTVAADLAFTPWAGFRSGKTRILSLEALVSVSAQDKSGSGQLGLERSGGLALGLGSRIGIVGETQQVPGVSLSFKRTTLPALAFRTTGIPTDAGRSIELGMSQFDGHVSSVRLAAEKHFGRLGVTAGWGNDDLQATAALEATITDPGGVTDTQGGSFDASRQVLFIGGSYRLSRAVSVAAEVSRATHTAPPSWNTVGTSSSWSSTLMSVGVQFGH